MIKIPVSLEFFPPKTPEGVAMYPNPEGYETGVDWSTSYVHEALAVDVTETATNAIRVLEIIFISHHQTIAER